MLFCCLSRGKVAAQSYSTINYRWEQGFTATTGYGICQDSKGYIWVGTENGLMRFNGREFKIYTTRDGLPDNEIFGAKEDLEGRLWLVPFAHTLSYIQHGKIFTASNSPVLKRLKLNRLQACLLFDKKGIIWLPQEDGLAMIRKDGSIEELTHITRDKPIGYCTIWLNAKGKLLLVDQDSRNIYRREDTAFVKIGVFPKEIDLGSALDTAFIYDYHTGNVYHYAETDSSVNFSLEGKVPGVRFCFALKQLSASELFVASDHGVYVFDTKRGKVKDSLLMGHKVGDLIRANDGALWFVTVGNGIFRLLDTKVKSLGYNGEQPSILYLKGSANGVYGISDKSVFVEAASNSKGIITYKERHLIVNKLEPRNITVYAEQNKNKDWIICESGTRLKREVGGKVMRVLPIPVAKAVCEEPPGHLLIATHAGVYRLDKERFRIRDTFMHDTRTTCVAKIKDTIYAGTLNGFFAIYPDKSSKQMACNNPSLRRHIMAMCTDSSGALWVANNNAELIGLRNNKVFVQVDLKKGLQCNRISCVKASSKWIWIGTDNGLFAIMKVPPYNIVRHLTYATGLNSNQINCLDICRERVWVGTIRGINYFDEDDVLKTRNSTEIIVNSIRNGGTMLEPSNDTQELLNESLTIDFDVVDYSGGTRPVFEYKLGDAAEWVTLENNHLYFPTLPYGDFTLTIRAFSPNWTSGALFRQKFHNPAPFYHGWGFVLAILVLVVLVAVIAVFFFIRRARKKDRDKLGVQQNLLLLEQMALQGQMNPHFIFNCIAAIKQYYSSGDTEKADNFVDSFSLLIRQTFELGTETFVSLDKELSYLAQYLNVEKARFNDSFQYHITRSTARSEAEILVPAMLLQPIAENAVRHGVRHLPDGNGIIQISVRQSDDKVEISIEDNGIGREKSNAMKGYAFLKSLTSTIVNKKRVDLLNRLLEGKIIMQTTDLYEKEVACGTRVYIAYPMDINQILKNENNYSRR